MPEAPRISVSEVERRMHAGEQLVFIDTRNPKAWAESDVKVSGAIRIPLEELDQFLDRIPKDKGVVAYCT